MAARASKRTESKRARSPGTGLFVLCNDVLYDADHQVWIEVKAGASGCHFYRCPFCGTRPFLYAGSAWRKAAKPLDQVMAGTAWKAIVKASGEVVSASP
jgi:hypothetical protein